MVIERNQIPREINDGHVRRYLIQGSILYVHSKSPFDEEDTHEGLAIGLGLEWEDVRGGYLKVKDGIITHEHISISVEAGDQSAIDACTEAKVF